MTGDAILGRNLERIGQVRPLVPHAAHHIVAGEAGLAEAARRVLKREGIDINDADNGVFVEETQHQRMHTVKYYLKVNEIILNTPKGEGSGSVEENRTGN